MSRLRCFCASIVLFLLSVLPQIGQSQDAEISLAKRLPNDIAILATLNDPGKQFDQLLRMIDFSENELQEMLDLLLFTDATDGTERVPESLDSDSKSTGFALLKNARSIHFVLTNSREKIGDWVILIDRGEDATVVPAGFCGLWLRVISQYWNHEKQIRQYVLPPDFGELLGRWEMTVHVEENGSWLCIGSSKAITSSILQVVNSDVPVVKSLADERTFTVYRNHALNNAFCSWYFSMRNSKRLLESLGRANESNWTQVGRDEIPWKGLWMRTEESAGSFRIERRTKVAATTPLAGTHQFWKFYRPLETFPPLPEGIQSVSGTHVDLKGWHETAKKIYPELYGEGVYEEYENNLLSAWSTGISRPKLGNIKFECWIQLSGKELPDSVLLYDIAKGTNVETIMGYLDSYYAEVIEAVKRNGYVADYKRTTVEGNPAWWTDDLKKEPAPRTIALSALKGGEEEAKDLKETDGENPVNTQSNTANGAVVIDGWVANGNRVAIDQFVEWTSPAQLKKTGAKQCEELVRNCASRLGIEDFYRFELQQDRSLKIYENKLQRLLYSTMPVGWAVRNGVFEEAKKNPKVVESFSRPQRLRFLLETAIENLRSMNPKRIQIDAFDRELTKSLTGESWIFEKK